MSDIIPAYHNIENHFLVLPDYRLVGCEIEKNMITIRRAVFCYLTNTTEFIAQNRSISTEFWDNRLCDDTFVYDSIDSVGKAYGTNLTLFTVIRHPIDRFLSGYVDKCIK
ncbi:hypothetical protein COOONC_09773 [Cooperia oncophora]